MSPNVGQYHMKQVPNSKETSAKISDLVTIFDTVPLIVAKAVRSGPFKLSTDLVMSPGKGIYCLKLMFDCKETNAKISVLVTILWIQTLIEAKQM